MILNRDLHFATELMKKKLNEMLEIEMKLFYLQTGKQIKKINLKN